MPLLKEAAKRVLSGELAQLGEAIEQREASLQLFEERMAELELALEDINWIRQGFENEKEFSREGLKKINQLARLYWIKNPLIKRAVFTQAQYVYGQGINISARHPLVNEVIQTFIDDEKNQSEFTSHQARMIKETELQCFANLFFVFFVNKSNGRVRIRTINMDEIEEIICNPEDAKEPWYYKRVWMQKRYDLGTGVHTDEQKIVYYPDWRYRPKGGYPAMIGRYPVERDTPVYHIKVNALSDMKFGVSEIYAAIDWARAYKEFLENWATIVKSYARFAWQLVAKGGTKGVAKAKDKLQSTLGITTGMEGNPSPVTASAFIGTEGTKLEPLKTAGATTKAEDGRRLLLMVSAATGIYEHYFGDPSTGNLATAKSMERPMELMFKDRQTFWADVMHDLLQFVVDQSARAPSGKIPGTVTVDDYGENIVVLGNDIENEEEDLRDKPIDRHIDIMFPDILEKDIVQKINAIVSAATLDGKPVANTLELKHITRLLLIALDEDNVDEIIERMFPNEGDGEGPIKLDPDEMMAEALRELREAVVKLAQSTETA